MENAEEEVTAAGGSGVEGRSDADAAATHRQKVAELNSRVERMARQLKSHADREVASLAQVKALKEELARKSSMLIKVKEEGAAAAGGGAPAAAAKVRFSPAVAEAREKEELRKTVRRLEERLRDLDVENASIKLSNLKKVAIQFSLHFKSSPRIGTESIRIIFIWRLLLKIQHYHCSNNVSTTDLFREVNQAERPLEDAPKVIGTEEKALKNAEEVARWDERKKWELKVEHFKKKLGEANEQVSKASKSNKGLRDVVARMERERVVLEGRAKALRGADKTQQAVHELSKERDRLQEELETAKHERMMNEAQGVETLRLRNKLLQVWRALFAFSCCSSCLSTTWVKSSNSIFSVL